MQPASAFNHIILSVSDLDRAKAFYGDLLGFAVQEVDPQFGSMFYFMVGEAASVWVMRHAATPADDRFSEFRIGLDHLAFTAPDEAWLRAMADRLIAAGVATQGVETFVTGNLYCAFRDPDNIQLEFWLD